MNFSIDTEVFNNFPELVVGVIAVSDIQNTEEFAELGTMLREEERKIVDQLDLETFKEHPNIASLQEVHRSFDSNPNKFPPSIQALVKRILKGGQLPSINPLVDAYNIMSLRYIVCAGAEDTDACEGDIRLAYADGSESFALIGSDEEDPSLPGELVYKDDVGVICRKLNWREGDRTRTSENTKNAVVVFEGFPPVGQETVEQAMKDCSELLQQYCQATTDIHVLTANSPLCSIN